MWPYVSSFLAMSTEVQVTFLDPAAAAALGVPVDSTVDYGSWREYVCTLNAENLPECGWQDTMGFTYRPPPSPAPPTPAPISIRIA